MLILKKLQVTGFKSFGDRAELIFPGAGVVGVVGPNGCGKSNLADAICWVLGEQSAKTLRGQRMEDVIFSGTRERPATGLAEVSLTLINPEEYEPPAGPGAEEPWPQIAGGEEWGEEAPEADGTGERAGVTLGLQSVADGAGDGVILRVRPRRKFTPHNRRGEIVLTRRLYRSGESEYLLNGRLCRLRDIQEIFLGTGLGPESYAIIEQGRIGQILTSKPHERRAMIEEAAGVTKYKARRKLAEAKLEAARQNLARVQDIFEEVEKQLAALKRQAAKARRHAELRQEWEALERRTLAAKAARLAAEWEGLKRELVIRGQALAECRMALETAEATRAGWMVETSRFEAGLREAGEELARLAMDIDRAERQISFNQQQSEDLQRRATRLGEEAEQLRMERERQIELSRESAAADEAAAQAAAAARVTLEARRGDGAEGRRQAAGLEQQLEAARSGMMAAMARGAQASNQAAQAETYIAALDRQLERVRAERQSVEQEAGALGARRGQLGLEFEREQERLLGLSAGVGDLESELAVRRQREQTARREQEQGRQALADVAAKRRSLEEIIAHHGANTEAVRRLLAAKADEPPDGFEPLGVLADFLEVEARYEGVVEEFLREELNYVVVKSWDEADAGVGLLRRDAQGRATFLVHPEDQQRTMFQAGGEAPRGEGAEGPRAGTGETSRRGDEEAAEGSGLEAAVPLRHCVRVLNGFGRSLEQILPKLGSGYILDDPAQARRLAAQNPGAYFLTGEGACFHNQTVTGGTRAGAGPLAIKREWRELARREGELGAQAAKLDAELALLGAELERLTARRTAVAREQVELEKALLTRGQALRQMESEAAWATERAQQLQLELDRGQAERQQAAEKLEGAREDRASAEAERLAREGEQAALSVEIAAARERQQQMAQTLAVAEAEAARWEERARASAAARAASERALRDLEQRAEHAAAEARALLQRRAPLDEATTELGRQAEARRRASSAAGERRRAAEAALTANQAAGAGLDAAVQAARARVEAAHAQHQESEVAAARLESEGVFLEQTCRSELGIELADLRAARKAAGAEDAGPTGEGMPAVPGAEAIAEWENAALAVKTKLANLGPVNMMALEEFQETEERHQFLSAQRQDLLDSAADTQKAMAELDAVCRKQFDAAWEQINLHFQETFRTLFGGGQGFLRLTDAENGGESGVDIVAQPPGKKLQNALLLSGGEKAMTAMALVLAIFQFQPSPFCLLDEVDAPLDEANVRRFTDMVRQLSVRTQFIVITHNTRTMESASVLYGVTMPKAGVSRLVSVELNGAPQAVSA